MVKSLLTYLLTGRKLKRKEKLYITLTITQKDISLGGCGLKIALDLGTLNYGTLNPQELPQDYYHTI